MYITSLNYKNVGPLGDININFRKDDNGVPVPLVIVGKNGSGKSILLSNIVDSFYEIASKVYKNVTVGSEINHTYYKIISPIEIKIGNSYMVSHICFEHKNNKFDYIFKSGNIEFVEYNKMRGNVINNDLNWMDNSNFKNVNIQNDKIIKEIFEHDVVCFFGPNRYIRPVWMGKGYDMSSEITSYSVDKKYDNVLKNPITAQNLPNITLQWLFDVIADSRLDMEINSIMPSSYISLNIKETNLLNIARRHAEIIMSEILCENIFFLMRNRAYGEQRFSIVSNKDKSVVAPSLDSLSTGQLSLFNLFSTIIRYADNDDINFSHKINEISGIVIIDEIELHLHAELQKEILPKLIKLFPKVQFIITSHSPLFLLGMKDVFGEDGFDIIELPSGNIISIEQFSEFENAYHYFINTDKCQKEIADAIDKVVAEKKDTALIITEGPTDWRHMKAAYESLCGDSRCQDWLPNLKFEFFEYDFPDNKEDKDDKFNMGGEELYKLCKSYKLIQQARRLIFIADRDVKNVIDNLEENNSYKSWGNNVFSFCLPVPEHRKETPDICIEHYYTDDEIKTEVALEDGKKRRLFMGKEFDSVGFSLDAKEDYFCKDKNSCGENKISIIDGSKKGKVVRPREDPPVNYALPKMDFATFILTKKAPFDHMDFSNFIPLFQTIRDILEE